MRTGTPRLCVVLPEVEGLTPMSAIAQAAEGAPSAAHPTVAPLEKQLPHPKDDPSLRKRVTPCVGVIDVTINPVASERLPHWGTVST